MLTQTPQSYMEGGGGEVGRGEWRGETEIGEGLVRWQICDGVDYKLEIDIFAQQKTWFCRLATDAVVQGLKLAD